MIIELPGLQLVSSGKNSSLYLYMYSGRSRKKTGIVFDDAGLFDLEVREQGSSVDHRYCEDVMYGNCVVGGVVECTYKSQLAYPV